MKLVLISKLTLLMAFVVATISCEPTPKIYHHTVYKNNTPSEINVVFYTNTANSSSLPPVYVVKAEHKIPSNKGLGVGEREGSPMYFYEADSVVAKMDGKYIYYVQSKWDKDKDKMMPRPIINHREFYDEYSVTFVYTFTDADFLNAKPLPVE